MKKLGILGVGKMGGSILEGIKNSMLLESRDILFYTPNEAHQKKYISKGYTLAENEKDLFENSENILLAIKPQMFSSVLEVAKSIDFNYRAVISIAAGKSINGIQSYFKNATIIRAMPNTPAFIQCATTTICSNRKNEAYDFAKGIFSSIGKVVEVEEVQIDAALPLNGSMPAYLYLFAKAFIENGVKYGLSYAAAKDLCCNAIIGSAQMILSSSDSIDTLIQNVCSKGGTTLAGLDQLYDNRFEDSISKCFTACFNRAKELNK